MRAAVLIRRGRFEIDRSYPDPRPNPTDIKLRIRVNRICGSDLRATAVAERDGSFAEYVVAPARRMFVVPPRHGDGCHAQS
jgi:threonine dehydrogenase-like Zn-dependent dehydrogenase